DLAKLKLSSIKNLFPETDENWNKKQWEDWFKKTINTKETLLADCNLEVWNMERYFNPNYIYTSRYYTNKDNNLIGIIEALPHYEDFKNQQFTLLDLKNQKTYNYNIHTNNNPFEESINHFVFDGNKLDLKSTRLNSSHV